MTSLLWLGAYLLSCWLIDKTYQNFLTVNDRFTFSYPSNYVVSQVLFNESIENSITTFTSGEVPKRQGFSTYQSLKENFSLLYPSDYILIPKDLGGEILYHVDFRDKEGIAKGFIQVWRLEESLDVFLEKSKQYSTIDFTSFSQKQVTVKNQPTFVWEYTFLSQGENPFHAMEWFMKKGQKLYRISYFVPSESWTDANSNIFWRMVNSFEVREP